MQNQLYKFDCGCSFPINDTDIKKEDGLPSIDLDYDNINMDCPYVWDLFKSGNTRGIFQLETQLGKTWSKKISPSNLEEIAALVSLLRPGCLRAIVDGKSMTQHYADRKNGLEEVTYFHDSLKNILRDTYGILTYQEQSMKIATDLAGFNLQEADTLRKAIGKKLPELMTKVEKEFTSKAKDFGILNEEECNAIFGWIRESQRYSFNKSHAATYGKITYWTAYVKAHFPLHFYTSWLYFAREKQFHREEIVDLVNDGVNNGYSINPPSLHLMSEIEDTSHFFLYDKNIYFGISDIKKVGDAAYLGILDSVREVELLIGRKIQDWTWNDFLLRYSNNLTKTVVNNLIACGATDYMKGPRSRVEKIFQYNTFIELDKDERTVIQPITNILSLKDGIQYIIGKTKTAARKKKLTDILTSCSNTSFAQDDSTGSIIRAENETLGVALTCSKLDSISSVSDTRCIDLVNGKTGKMDLTVEIASVRKHIIKNGDSAGKSMAFLQIKDNTGSFDSCVIFSANYDKYKHLLYKGNTLIVKGECLNRKGDLSFMINEVVQV